MEGKVRFIFLILATGIIVFVVSSVVTFTDVGLRADFVGRWLSAFFVGWPVALITGLIVFPFVRRTTVEIVALLERTFD